MGHYTNIITAVDIMSCYFLWNIMCFCLFFFFFLNTPLYHIPLIPLQRNVFQFSFLTVWQDRPTACQMASRSLVILILFLIHAVLQMPVDPICALVEIL